jgi:hypothetical protein
MLLSDCPNQASLLRKLKVLLRRQSLGDASIRGADRNQWCSHTSDVTSRTPHVTLRTAHATCQMSVV